MGLSIYAYRWRIAVLLSWLHISLVQAAGIVVDGGTATTVTTASSGRQTVNIAAAVSGISHNTYSEFSVGSAGAALNNVGVNARTIVNQVTSTNPSLIQGDITVLGSRANVIIANPNGITVNGGSFVNTGNVALSTGQVSFNDITLSPGNVQRNIVLDTSQGQIVIGPEGLSGAMLDLELIAKQISINGPVLNTVSNSAARINAVAGASHAEVDGSVSPTDLISTWIGITASGTSNPGATTLDITPLGSLTAGRVELVVTEQGAGVRNAGAIYANVGDFTIAGNGDLHIVGGSIQAAGDVVIANASVDSQSDQGRMASIQANGSIDISAAQVALTGISLKAGVRTTDSSGNTSVTQRGNILIGTDGVAGSNDLSLAGVVFDATGGIGIYDAGRQVQITASSLLAEQDVEIKSQNFSLTGGVATATIPATSVTSNTGTVSMTMTDALQIAGAAINGAAGVSISANSLSTSALLDAGSAQKTKSRIQSAAADVAITTTAATTLMATAVSAAQNILIQSGSFSALNDGLQASTVVANGGLLINSSGAISNVGSVLQGNTRITGNSASQGAVTLLTQASFTNQSPQEGMLGIVFGLNDDVVIQATQDISNQNARLLSNNQLLLSAGGTVTNMIGKDAGANGEQATSYAQSSSRWLMLTQRTSGFDIDYGQVTMPDQLAYLVGENGIAIQAANFINQGGIGLVNNGNMTITVGALFQNEALLSGSAHYQRTCLFVCSATASSNVTTYGGTLSASGNISISAGTQAANIGGEVLALGDLSVTAPSIYAQGIVGYRAYTQSGMKTWFGSDWARLYATDTGGTWVAGKKLSLQGQGIIDGGSFTGMLQLIAPNGILTLRKQQSDPVSIQNHLGLGSWL
jgi:filamentous hemagglutinin family protein